MLNQERRQHEEDDVARLLSEYTAARRRLEARVNEAAELGERFERLGHGLATHPARMIVGVPDRVIENPSDWDIVPSHPLPSIEHLEALVTDLRACSATVEDLRARLILLGRADLVEQPDGFFR